MTLIVISIDVTPGYGDFTCRINGKDFIETFHYFLYLSLSDPMAGWQSEMGVYIEKYSDIMEWNKEESFQIDGRVRKGKSENKITIDLSYRRKKYTKDKFVFVELTQSDDTTKCIENMCSDVVKVRSTRKKSQYGNQIRDLFLVGVHPKQELPDDEIQKLVISKLEDRHEDFITCYYV